MPLKIVTSKLSGVTPTVAFKMALKPFQFAHLKKSLRLLNGIPWLVFYARAQTWNGCWLCIGLHQEFCSSGACWHRGGIKTDSLKAVWDEQPALPGSFNNVPASQDAVWVPPWEQAPAFLCRKRLGSQRNRSAVTLATCFFMAGFLRGVSTAGWR